MSPGLSPLSNLRAWLETHTLRRVASILGLVLLAVYAGMAADEMAFDNGFIISDDKRLSMFSIESIHSILKYDYWSATMASNLYRPLTTLSFWFENSFLGYGDTPLGYQVTNALLHWVNAMLVFMLGRRLGLGPLLTLAAALLYALHPICVEAVANIVGRSDLIATMGVLGGLLAYFSALDLPAGRRGRRIALAGLIGFVAMTAKESAIVLPALIAWHGLLRLGEWHAGGEARRRWYADAWMAALAMVPIACFFLVTRWVFSSQAGVTDHPFIDNPLMIENFLVSRLSALGVWGMQIWSLLLPLDLSNDYSFNAIPAAAWPMGNATALWGWGTLLLFAAFTLWMWRLRRLWSAGLFLWGAYVIAMLPTSNLILKIGSIRADRFHYTSSAFGWLCVLGLAGWIISRTQPAVVRSVLRFAWVPLAAWSVCLAAIAHVRCYDWRSNLELWTSAAVTQPDSAKVMAASGNARVMVKPSLENERAALQLHLRALQTFKTQGVPMYHWPMRTYSDIMATYLGLYEREILSGKKGPEVDMLLDQGLAVYDEFHRVEALVMERWLVKYKGRDINTAPFLDTLQRNYAMILSHKGRHEEAKAVMARVMNMLPFKAQNHAIMAEICYEAGDYRQALMEQFLLRVMEPEILGDLNKIAEVARKVDPKSSPLLPDGNGQMKLNLNDALIKQETRNALIFYRKTLLRAGQSLEAFRVERLARYYYGINDLATQG